MGIYLERLKKTTIKVVAVEADSSEHSIAPCPQHIVIISTNAQRRHGYWQ
jgi:hypothetical protein